MSELRARSWRLIKRHPVAIVLGGSWAVFAVTFVVQEPPPPLLTFLIMPAYVSWLGMVVVSVGISESLPPVALVPLLFLVVWLLDRFASAWIDE